MGLERYNPIIRQVAYALSCKQITHMKNEFSPCSTNMPGNVVTNPWPGTWSDQNCLLSLPHYLGYEGRRGSVIPEHPLGTQINVYHKKVEEEE